MKVSLWYFLLLFICGNSFGQSNYNSATIPASLKTNAHSVVRSQKISFDVKDISEAVYNVVEVITVLDAEGEDQLFFKQYSDVFRKLDRAEIKVFDAAGNPVNRYSMKEMKTQATGGGLVEDGKVTYFRVSAPSYPITVQFDYTIKYKGTLNYPTYYIAEPDQSVESSIYTATVPSDLDIRYKPKNINITPTIQDLGKKKTYTWEIKNHPAAAYEEGAVSYESSYPEVLMAPNEFAMDGNKGSLNSWKGLGLWFGALSKGSINLSAETKEALTAMVKNATNDKEKARIIYSYLQERCRYVSIQLGIGGYKPFDAKFVDQKKYGDCKALTNYMHACLDAIGVVSYPALINAGYNKEPVDLSFPHNSFNHVILCMPLNGDTTWLECTSNSAAFGVLGNFTENRNALLIKPDGGELVATPKSKQQQNIFSTHTKVLLEENASGICKTVLTTNGLYKEEINSNIIDEKRDEQKKYLVNSLGFILFDDFEIATNINDTGCITTLQIAAAKIPEFSAGSKMFLNPRIYKMWNVKLPKSEGRTKSFYFKSPFIKTDTTVYFLPKNFTVENLPAARNITSALASFKSNCTYDAATNSITTTAFLSLSQNIIPSKDYAETLQFFSRVIEEYLQKIVIKKS
jgi:Domain of Unknown Function with PDB structure (DUF3857)